MPAIQRRPSATVQIGGIRVGSNVPVVVQSMTNTDTADIESTIQQVAALARAGRDGPRHRQQRRRRQLQPPFPLHL